ncbi:MAG TPA: hypothetical protein VFO67_03935 [Gemmatimonadales bacterium]|nr:hypothetical protein [Gemmatimonadales bacterium]
MSPQRIVVSVIAAVLLLALSQVVAAQTKTFTTPWGHPDLQGVWNNQTPVPMERPKALGNKASFTKEEAAAAERDHAKTIVGFINQLDPTNACPPEKEAGCVESLAVWMDTAKVARNLRTSLVVSPADGQIPFTAEGRKRWLSTPAAMSEAGELPANRPEDRTHTERCVAFGGLFDPNPFFSNYHSILQTPEYVVIVMEEGHDQRIIPLDGRRHVGSNIRSWLGDPRGHWEGQTLVVETTNYNDRMLFRGATRNLRTIERFTRVAADAIDYEVTFTDPATYATPWTVQNTLWRSDAGMYESDCHEGNYGLANILSAARADEKKK